MVSFEKLIEVNTLNPAQRLHYLMQYTAGDANTLVSGYMLCTSEHGYQTAKKELIKEYGDPYVMARTYLTRIETWKPISPNDVASLRTFNTFLKRCKGSMPSLRHLQQLNTDLYLQKIVLKLPYGLQACWRKAVSRIEETGGDVTFKDLVDLVDQQARIAKHPVFLAEALLEADGGTSGRRQAHVVESGKKTLLATHISAPSQQSSTSDSADREVGLSGCIMCSCLHDLDECRSYMDLSIENKKQFLVRKRLCFACYGTISADHTARTCRCKRTCQICGNLHPTGLHDYNRLPQPRRQTQHDASNSTNSGNVDGAAVDAVLTTCATDVYAESMTMSIVMVRLIHDGNPQHEVTVYAALDGMSSASFISGDVLSLLGAPGVPTDITIRTMSDVRSQSTVAVSNLSRSSRLGNDFISLPKVYKQDSLPLDINEVPSLRMLLKWPHLHRLISEMPERNEDIPIGLLIGVNCPRALQPCDFIPSVNDCPFADKTSLGWCVSGSLQSESDNICSDDVISCFRIRASEERVRTTETISHQMMLRMHERDFNENASGEIRSDWPQPITAGSSEDVCSSHEESGDRQFLNIMKTESRFVKECYQLPLPFRIGHISMPSNRDQRLLENIEITGCFKPLGFNLVISASLHNFLDASQTGCGQSSCLHLIGTDGRVRCSLVMWRSRVAPLKPVTKLTTPRWELTAATVPVKDGAMLESELQYSNISSTYWTDSRVVLGYINNDVRRFHMFVANRVHMIREDSDIATWRYVDSDCNPADYASRGIDCFNIFKEHRWFLGLRFLWGPEDG